MPRHSSACCHYSVLLLLAGLLLFGCSVNQSRPAQVSTPNEYSAYFFSAGNVLYYSEQYDLAERIYRVAQRYDPGSEVIRRNLFDTLYKRVKLEQIPLAVFSSYADSVLALDGLDKLGLELYYNALIESGNQRKAKAILDLYLKSYQTPLAYTSLFYLEQQLRHKTRLELLDKALALAANDAGFLISLGKLWLPYDSTKAEQVWRQALPFDATGEAATLLWELLAKRGQPQTLKDFFNSFSLETDDPKLAEVLSQTAAKGDYQSILSVSDLILQTNQSRYIVLLLYASWSANETMDLSLRKLRQVSLTPQQLQMVDFYAALRALKGDDPLSVWSSIGKLNGKGALDELITEFRASVLSGDPQADAIALDNLKQQLRRKVSGASEKELPWQIKDYLLALVDGLTVDNQPEPDDDTAKNCALYYHDTDRRSYDNYIWLANYYQKVNNKINMRVVLRQALKDYPEDASLLNWLGYSYAVDDFNLDEAEVLILRAIQLSPGNPYFMDSLAWVRFNQEKYNDALKLMDLPSRLQDMPTEIAYHMARILVSLDQYDAALNYLNLIIDRNDEPEYTQDARTILNKMGY